VKHKLIVEQQITNQVVDMGQLMQTAEPAQEVLGVETIDVVAEKGYFSKSRISRLVRRPGWCPMCRVRSVVPRSRQASSARTKSNTTRPADSYVCPAG
jgi:hypothetical protein